MRIDDYGFGQISIDGDSFAKDVLVLPPRVVSPWWRRDGHRLDMEDLGEVVDYGPTALVIGTGAHGAMRVPDETLAALDARGITVEVVLSRDAVARFNELAAAGQRVAAAIHLTC